MSVRIGITGGLGAVPGLEPDDKPTRDFWLAVRQAGGEPWVLPSLEPANAAEHLAGLDGVLFTGGADIDPGRYGESPRPELGPLEPDRDAFELALFPLAWAMPGLPILGVCRGMQLMNVALGGTLYQDLPTQRPTDTSHAERARKNEHVHAVRLAPDSRLGAILGNPAGVNSLHHQAVKDLAPGLRAVAWSPDGVIEGVEAPGDAFRVAAQWHPEILASWEGPSQALFRAFIEAARAHQATRGLSRTTP
jgi:putative glutamine amidotransferase